VGLLSRTRIAHHPCLLASDTGHAPRHAALTRCSAYFRKVLESGIPSNPIPINANTKVLKLHLDLVHYKSIPPSWVWQHKDAVLKLSDELGSPGPAERALFVLHERVHKDPWAMFCLASQKGNVSLAKSALKALADAGADANPEGHQHRDITSLTPGQVAHVTLPYLLGLYNAALAVQHEHPHGHAHSHAHQHEISWKAIADRFSPVMA
jgi:hypothetical protein